MHLKVPAALAAAAIAAAAPAQQQDGDAAFAPERFRAHVAFLADDRLEGRNAGERGHDLAALYVATQFEGLGLKPAAGEGWYQHVPLHQAAPAEAAATITIGERRFVSGVEVILYPNALEQRLQLEAPVVFAGYGIDAPEQGFTDYAGLDVRGKIVVLLTGVPKGIPSEVGAHLTPQKEAMAAKRGAVGVLNITTLARQERTSWARLIRSASRPQTSWVGRDDKPHSDAPGIRITGYLGSEAAGTLFTGARRQLSAVLQEADREGGRPKGFALLPQMKIEQQSNARRTSSPNVLALLPGSDPGVAGEYVVLMAHLDHIGLLPAGEGDRINNGALDNAGGVATLIEAARAMAGQSARPRRPILFAAVTAEEDGLLGSQYLAKHPVIGEGKVVAVVNLDMPILLYDFTDVIAFGAEHSTLGPVVERAAARMNVAVSPDPLPQERLFTRSDHYMFVREGIPSVFLMTGFAGEGREKFTSFLATHYHRPTDDLNLPIDWRAGAKFARLNYLVAREIADAPERPLWYADSFFGNSFAPDRPKAPRR